MKLLFVEIGKVDRLWNKLRNLNLFIITEEETGWVDLNDQLLNYYTFVCKSLK